MQGFFLGDLDDLEDLDDSNDCEDFVDSEMYSRSNFVFLAFLVFAILHLNFCALRSEVSAAQIFARLTS